MESNKPNYFIIRFKNPEDHFETLVLCDSQKLSSKPSKDEIRDAWKSAVVLDKGDSKVPLGFTGVVVDVSDTSKMPEHAGSHIVKSGPRELELTPMHIEDSAQEDSFVPEPATYTDAEGVVHNDPGLDAIKLLAEEHEQACSEFTPELKAILRRAQCYGSEARAKCVAYLHAAEIVQKMAAVYDVDHRAKKAIVDIFTALAGEMATGV